MTFYRLFTQTSFASALLSVSLQSATASTTTAQQQFFQHLSALCGKAFAGKVVVGNASDDKMRNQPLLMHVRECSDTEIKVPLQIPHLGDHKNRYRPSIKARPSPSGRKLR